MQMRRSSASIPTNIAEGCGRSTDGDLRRFLDIAMGSASELEYQLLLAHDLAYLHETACIQLIAGVVESQTDAGSVYPKSARLIPKITRKGLSLMADH